MKPMNLILLVGLTITMTSCSKENITQPKAQNAYALRSTDNSWPRLDEQSTNKKANMLTENYYIMLDNSSTMQDTKCINDGRSKADTAKLGLISFITQAPKNKRIGLAGYDYRGLREYVPLYDSNREKLTNAINTFVPEGNISFGKAINLGYQALETQAVEQMGYGEYHLILITDGQPKKGNIEQALTLAINDSPVMVHAFSICSDNTNTLNKEGVSYHSIYTRGQLEKALMATLSQAQAES